MHDVTCGGDADITFSLHAPLERHASIVFPQVFLALHALDCLILFLPDAGDVQQDVRLPTALFRLMRLKTIDRRRLHDRFTRTVSFCLGDTRFDAIG